MIPTPARRPAGNPHVEVVVGLDIGTTTSKALIRRLDDRAAMFVVDAATVWTTTAAGETQTSAQALLATALDLVNRAVAAAQEAWAHVRVRAVSVTGLAESGILLDPAGRPAQAAIAWFDTRGQQELAEVARRHPAVPADFAAVTGLPYSAQASFAKMLWARGQHGPTGRADAIPAGSRWLNVPEWVVHALGGDQVREPSLASRTGLIEQRTGRPWDVAMDLIGAPADLLPADAPAGTPVGTLSHPDVAAAAQGAVLSVAGHDHPVAALAVGAAGIGDLFNSTGTADVLARAVARPLSDGQRAAIVAAGWSAGAHVVPGVDLLLGGGSGGLLLRRVLAALGAESPEGRRRLDEDSARLTALPPGLLVFGDSRRSDDVEIRLRDGASPAALWRAATLATAQLAREMLDDIDVIVGPHHRAVAAGGWVRMASVRAAKATAIAALEVSDLDQPGATGAALLAQHSLDAREPLSAFLQHATVRHPQALTTTAPHPGA